MDLRRVALLLAVVGLLCLPAPLYLGWAAEATAPPAQTSQVYSADPIDLDNESDREELVHDHREQVTFSVYPLTWPNRNEEYRSPNATRDALRTAMRGGSATVDDDGARADLRGIAADHQFVRDTHEGVEGTYRLSVEENGSVVRTTNATDDEIAAAIAAGAPEYESLSTGEQRTVDRILDNSTDGESGYRPYLNDPFVDQLPTPVSKGDTLYSISVAAHVDDFGPGFGGVVAGVVVAIVGVSLLFTAAVIYLFDRYHAGSADQ
ncbi:MAG: hypothetical protein ACOCQU_03180 [Halolamina sp.]